MSSKIENMLERKNWLSIETICRMNARAKFWFKSRIVQSRKRQKEQIYWRKDRNSKCKLTEGKTGKAKLIQGTKVSNGSHCRIMVLKHLKLPPNSVSFLYQSSRHASGTTAFALQNFQPSEISTLLKSCTKTWNNPATNSLSPYWDIRASFHSWQIDMQIPLPRLVKSFQCTFIKQHDFSSVEQNWVNEIYVENRSVQMTQNIQQSLGDFMYEN